NQTIKLLNRILEIEVKPQYGPPRLGDVLHSRADITLAREILGYEPIVSYEEGLRRTVAWLRTEMG
ncbi:MAG: LPS biosynthesis protein WbpP, partial [Terracidiphilus sp.]